MKKIVSKDMNAQASEVAEIIADYVRKKPDALLCLAAGDSATGTYRAMARLQREGKADFRRCRLVGLDEWVGLGEAVEGGCRPLYCSGNHQASRSAAG